MSMPFAMPFGVTVTVQRQSEDRFGNFTVTATHSVGPCAIENSGGSGRPSSQEVTDNAETVTRKAVLYVPPGSDFQSTDRVVLPDGTRWEVVGDVAESTSPFTGWAPGGSVQLRRVTG